MKTMKKKLLAMIAVVVMIVTMIPSMAFATDGNASFDDCVVVNGAEIINIETAVKDNANTGTELTVEIYGTVTMTGSLTNAGKVKFVGKTEDATIDLGGIAHTASNAELTFEKITVKKTNANYNGFHHSAKETFVNCTIEGTYWPYATIATFTDCIFNQSNPDAYNVWCYGKNAIFTGCTFNLAGKSVLVYNEGASNPATVKISDCKFVANDNYTEMNKAAVEIDSTYLKYDVTMEGCEVDCKITSGFYRDKNPNSGNTTMNLADDNSVKHALVKIEASEPDPCQMAGRIECWHCEGCGKYFTDAEASKVIAEEDTFIDPGTHEWTTYEAKEPSCVEGNIKYYVCNNCDEIQAEFEEGRNIAEKLSDVKIPATGVHSYKDGVCTICKDEVKVVTPVVEKEATEITTKEVETVVEAIVAGKETDAVDEKTAEAIKNVPQGNEIVTEVVAEVVTEEEVKKEAAADVKAIDETVGEDGEVAQYLDLSVVIKSIAPNGDETELGTLNKLSKPIPITLVIPEDLQVAGRTFYVIRVHDGEVDKLPLTKNADGSYTFTTDRFSTYALAYEDGAPNTGDNSAVMTYAVLAVAAMAVVVVLKRRNLFAK